MSGEATARFKTKSEPVAGKREREGGRGRGYSYKGQATVKHT